ncbi:LANO_0G14686g1_1 [Lachancea nothofagi CBS 11611]|uniref:Large ribosomal subunit protein bL32m n=1 Tax=Lachancea nothofagi CBS 11611 TaxID=1266666 RepID=A0A1G4KKD6_9SACH|nr:LANO_0G14686g1_1 [Lachancea nothofagi CBS 11611]
MSFTALLKLGRGLRTSLSVLPSLKLTWETSLSPQASSTRIFQKLLDKGNEQQIDDLLTDNGILLAVPKKKVSHQKKRQKLYGPGRKQLQMIHHLNRCPSCGHFKRANTLCMHCVGEIRHIWKAHTVKETSQPIQELELSELDKRVLYPGKKETEYTKN